MARTRKAKTSTPATKDTPEAPLETAETDTDVIEGETPEAPLETASMSEKHMFVAVKENSPWLNIPGMSDSKTTVDAIMAEGHQVRGCFLRFTDSDGKVLTVTHLDRYYPRELEGEVKLTSS